MLASIEEIYKNLINAPEKLIPVLISALMVILIFLPLERMIKSKVSFALGDDEAETKFSIKRSFDILGVIGVPFSYAAGWSKAIPFRKEKYSNPIKAAFLISLSGTAFFLASAIIVLIGGLIALIPYAIITYGAYGDSGFGSEWDIIYYSFLLLLYRLGLLSVINLLPIPPFNGSLFVASFMNDKLCSRFLKLGKYTRIILAILAVFGITDMIMEMLYSMVGNIPI